MIQKKKDPWYMISEGVIILNRDVEWREVMINILIKITTLNNVIMKYDLVMWSKKFLLKTTIIERTFHFIEKQIIENCSIEISLTKNFRWFMILFINSPW